MSLAEGLAATALSYRAANPLCNKSMPCTRWVMSLAIGPTVSKCFGEIGNTPLMGTRPKVVFKPRMPQQAAGGRMAPAVSVPKAKSVIRVSPNPHLPLPCQLQTLRIPRGRWTGCGNILGAASGNHTLHVDEIFD